MTILIHCTSFKWQPRRNMDNFCDCNGAPIVNDMSSGDLISCLVQINKINNLFTEASADGLASSSSSSYTAKVTSKANIHNAFVLKIKLLEEILKNVQGQSTSFVTFAQRFSPLLSPPILSSPILSLFCGKKSFILIY